MLQQITFCSKFFVQPADVAWNNGKDSRRSLISGHWVTLNHSVYPETKNTANIKYPAAAFNLAVCVDICSDCGGKWLKAMQWIVLLKCWNVTYGYNFFGFSLTFYVTCAKCLCLRLRAKTGFISPKTSCGGLLSFDGVVRSMLAILLVGVDQGIWGIFTRLVLLKKAQFVLFLFSLSKVHPECICKNRSLVTTSHLCVLQCFF